MSMKGSNLCIGFCGYPLRTSVHSSADVLTRGEKLSRNVTSALGDHLITNKAVSDDGGAPVLQQGDVKVSRGKASLSVSQLIPA
jgi:hypothetical protein